MLDVLTDLKLLLNTTDEARLTLYVEQAEQEVLDYCHIDTLDEDIIPLVEKMVVFKWNQRNSAGLSSVSANGVSESYLTDYPASIKNSLNCRRKLKVI